MAVQVRGTEEFFLKLVKFVILGLMGIALIAVPVLLFYGGANFMSQSKEPAPAQVAPLKDVSMEGFATALIEDQKKRDEMENFDPSKKKATEQDQPVALFLTDAVEILRCMQKFAISTDMAIPIDYDPNAAAMRYRVDLENAANRPGRGEPYVLSLRTVLCKVVEDPEIITLRKEKKYKASIHSAVTNFHRAIWDRNVAEKNKFDNDELARVAFEKESEALRVAADRAKALAALTAAGAAFVAFMMLALYLLMTKIETNMRDINESIRSRES